MSGRWEFADGHPSEPLGIVVGVDGLQTALAEPAVGTADGAAAGAPTTS